MQKIKEFLRKNWLRMLIAFLVGIALMALYNVLQQFMTSSGSSVDTEGLTPEQIAELNNQNKIFPWNKLEYYRDGSFIAGMILLFVGGLAIVGKMGIFDIFSYYPGRKKKENGYKENYGEYVERKRYERSTRHMYYLSYFYISALFLVFSIITLIITTA